MRRLCEKRNPRCLPNFWAPFIYDDLKTLALFSFVDTAVPEENKYFEVRKRTGLVFKKNPKKISRNHINSSPLLCIKRGGGGEGAMRLSVIFFQGLSR